MPLGQVKSNFNYNLDEKRVLNFKNVVNDNDNIKQDMSIDVRRCLDMLWPASSPKSHSCQASCRSSWCLRCDSISIPCKRHEIELLHACQPPWWTHAGCSRRRPPATQINSAGVWSQD